MKKLITAAMLAVMAPASAGELSQKQVDDLIGWTHDQEMANYKKACEGGDNSACKAMRKKLDDFACANAALANMRSAGLKDSTYEQALQLCRQNNNR